jgi:hypothetical protein
MSNDFIKIKKKIFMGEARAKEKETIFKKMVVRRDSIFFVALFFL